jgi:hypothetical protein
VNSIGSEDLATLVISPHFDDAVLSASALLQPGAYVVTVFAGAPAVPAAAEWDLRCGFVDSDDAQNKRRSEDDLAFAGLAVTRSHLDLLDGQYGGDQRAHDEQLLREVVRAWVRDNPDGIVVVPIAAGANPNLVDKVRWRIPSRLLGQPRGGPPNADHEWVRDVVQRAVAASTIGYYRDFPYALSDHRSNDAYGLPNHIVHELAPAPDKARRVAAYVSQVPNVFPRWCTSLDWLSGYPERFWIPRRR